MSSISAAPAAAPFRRARSGGGLLTGILLGFVILVALVLGSARLRAPHGPGGSATLAAAGSDSASAGDSVAPFADLHSSRRTAIVEAARRVGPSVVTLSVEQTRMVQTSPVPFGSEFFEPFFRDMIPQYRYKEVIPSMGSGFIVSKDGTILTNAHVVQGASKITVILPDGRNFTARIIGVHPQYDLAVVKVDGKDLPVAPLGTSGDLMVGEWAIAIGNPFGYLLNDTQPTVTAGVVSATHRDIKSQSETGAIYKNMIQTDAAINPGNSGGPLVNARGDVIGVNTFIFTKSGGSEGIGFAIPIDVAKKIVDEVVRYGRIRTVWIGVRTWDLTPYLAERLGTVNRQGLYVASLERGSPADKAGVRAGDIIRKVNGTPVRDSDEAYRAIFGANVGDTITLLVEREGKDLTIKLLLEEAPE
jgi:serine protease Do